MSILSLLCAKFKKESTQRHGARLIPIAGSDMRIWKGSETQYMLRNGALKCYADTQANLASLSFSLTLALSASVSQRVTRNWAKRQWNPIKFAKPRRVCQAGPVGQSLFGPDLNSLFPLLLSVFLSLASLDSLLAKAVMCCPANDPARLLQWLRQILTCPGHFLRRLISFSSTTAPPPFISCRDQSNCSSCRNKNENKKRV